MNNRWILADWHLYFVRAFAEKMFQVYLQPAGKLNISQRQKDNQWGKICILQTILFSSLSLGTVGLLFLFVCLLVCFVLLLWFVLFNFISFLLLSFDLRGRNYCLVSPSEGLSQTLRSQFAPCSWWSLFQPSIRPCCSEQSPHDLEETFLFSTYCTGNQLECSRSSETTPLFNLCSPEFSPMSGSLFIPLLIGELYMGKQNKTNKKISFKQFIIISYSVPWNRLFAWAVWLKLLYCDISKDRLWYSYVYIYVYLFYLFLCVHVENIGWA